MKRFLVKYLVMITIMLGMTTASAVSGWWGTGTFIVWRGGW